ncbi:hypothetical protein ACSTIB_23590, partial [Vibrio parahaemolyticus]
ASAAAIPGEKLALPGFDFGMPADDALPALIDRRGAPPPTASMPDLGARLRSFILEHPDPVGVAALYRSIA